MAGMKGRSGGARVGAGRKPLSQADRWMRGKPSSSPVVAPATGAVTTGHVPMPDDLVPAVAAVWMALAPHALAEQTLTTATAFAFEKLCGTVVLEQELAESPMRRGGADHRGVMQRLEMGLARFRLTGDGKPRILAPASQAVVQSPLQKLQAEGAQLRRVK